MARVVCCCLLLSVCCWLFVCGCSLFIARCAVVGCCSLFVVCVFFLLVDVVCCRELVGCRLILFVVAC